MRKSNSCCQNLKKCFKRQANRELRNERKELCRKILSGTDADNVCFTPACRTGYIYQWWD